MKTRQQLFDIVGIALLISASLSAHAADGNQKTCSEAEEQQALNEADSLKDWNAVHNSFKRFVLCDDGAIAEGYSDTVGRLLTKNWKEISTLGTLTAADHEFERFVLRHIDETLDADELRSVARNATRNCPTVRTRFARRYDPPL